MDSTNIETAIIALEAFEIDDSFAEFYGQAVEARADALIEMREILAAKMGAEAEAERVKAEQEAAKELADKIVAENFAKQQDALRIEREKFEQEQTELKRQQAEIQSAKDAEAARISAEKAEADRIVAEARAAEDARIAAEKQYADAIMIEQQEREAKAKARLEACAAELLAALIALVEFTEERIGDNECRPLENAKRAIENTEAP
jgi:fused signal recognition particle receptor